MDYNGKETTIYFHPGAPTHISVGAGDGPNIGFYPEGNPFGSQGQIKDDSNKYSTDSKTFNTTPEQEKIIRDYMEGAGKSQRYNVFTNNCAQVASDALGAAGIDVPRVTAPGAFMMYLQSK